MPLAAIVAGLIVIDLAFRGTEHGFAKALAADFGKGSTFWAWAAAIGGIGALGYVESLRRISGLLLGLIIVVMVLRNGGLFTQLAALIAHPPSATPAIPISSYKAAAGGTAGGTAAATAGGKGGGSGGGLAGAGQGALSGAAEGAVAGSVIPGVGTAVGAVVGAIGGAIFGGTG